MAPLPPHHPSIHSTHPAWDILHFLRKRTSIESNPSEDGSVVGDVDDAKSMVRAASSSSVLGNASGNKHMFKALMVRRLSKLRLIDPERRHPTPPSTTTVAATAADAFDQDMQQLSTRTTFLLDTECKSCEWTPQYPWFRVLTEIIDTEVCFVETLETLHDVFDQVFSHGHTYTHPSLLSLRAATESLLALHGDIIESLHRPTDTLHLALESLEIARTFRTRLPYFKLYAQYCLAYKEVSALLRVRKRLVTTELQQFVGAVCATAQLLHVDMQSEMIKPVQRLCRYPLLFGELLHQAATTTATVDSSGVVDELTGLLDATKAIASFVNDRVQTDQNNAKFLRLRRKLSLGFGCPEVLVPSRQYVLEAPAHVSTLVQLVPWRMWFTKPRTLVLFSDVLLIAKRLGQKRLQACKMLPLTMLAVDDLGDEATPRDALPKWSHRGRAFVFRYAKSETQAKTYVVVCDCEKKKLELVRQFRETIAKAGPPATAAAAMASADTRLPSPQAFSLRHVRLPSSASAV
ncbi:Aste57867_19925 [Aphanomyces stellatus]|uniref:Aste57867_19925 protein n=1 Tax=Aphanomyces stellatus TaxID=120398 RepID=A0A485LIE3_9STRA|nr:hypothetical protein As57867_019859 [Aphanomyces stellatus]VFT96623.1 Aste57867_19925 [Aphanomyces stellatus]